MSTWFGRFFSNGDSMDIVEQTAALLARVALRDQGALRLLYQLVGSRLLAVAMRITQDKALAEDTVQEVLVTVWHQTAVRAPGQSLSLAWLCVVTRHRAIDLMRKTRPTVPLTWQDSEGEEHQHEVPDETGSPLTQLLNHEDDHQLSRCLKALDDQPRQAMLLGFYEGLTHMEIAARMSKPLGTVKAWVRRSLMSLKVCMEAAA
jgi:RNA polymerase sigma-70 factor, ECF subfamily